MSQAAPQILKRARKKLGLNQSSFAKQFGKSQGSFSKYESGNVPPPSEVIMRCMNILNTDQISDSVDDLIERVGRLEGQRHSKVRKALNALLDVYLDPH